MALTIWAICKTTEEWHPGAHGHGPISSVSFVQCITLGQQLRRFLIKHVSLYSAFTVEVGLCSSEGCECGTPHGPLCGCPHCNCNHHHHPPFCHDICTYGCNSTSSGNVNGNGQNSDYENVADDQRDVGQQGSSRRNWIYALVAAAVATAGVGAFAIRKRVRTWPPHVLHDI